MNSATKYEKLARLGQSESASVYRARHLEIDALRAIKELREDQQLNPKRKERFFKEAEQFARLGGDGFVTIYDVDRARGWIIMELMARSAADLIASGPQEPQQVLEILRQSLAALDWLHQQGILHLNIKPTNLLFDARSKAKLSDGRGARIGALGELPAPSDTHKYLAPEILDEAAGTVGPATDLYCLGFVALELLAGPRFASLFKGMQGGEGATRAWMRWHSSLNEKSPAAREVASAAPPQLCLVIDRLLSKSLSQRYGRAADALDDLAAKPVERQAPEPTRPGSAPYPAPAAAGNRPDADANRPAPPPPAAERPAARGRGASEASVDHLPASVLARPRTPIILRIASGPRVGEMVGLDSDQVRVGESDDCQLRFSLHDYPAVAGRSIQIHRDSDGWKLTSLGCQGLMCNKTLGEEPRPLRSGDLVRMSLQGPDFQFIVQSPGTNSLADDAVGILSLSGRPAKPAASSYAPAPPQAAGSAPSPPQPAARQHAAPAPPPKSAPKPVAPSPPSHAPPPQPAAASAGVHPSAPATAPRSGAKWWEYSKWEKRTQNLVVGIIASIVAILVVIFYPVGEEKPPENQPAGQSTLEGTNPP